jgi:hypothetical protein
VSQLKLKINSWKANMSPGHEGKETRLVTEKEVMELA